MTEELGETEKTLIAELGDVFDEIEKREEPADDVVEEPAEEVEEDTQEAKEPEEAGQAPAEEVTEKDEEETQELTAPENWKQEHKDAFNGLDDSGKTVLLEQSKSLERGANRKFREIADITKEHEAIVGLMAPVEAQLNAAGLDRIGGIRTLLGAQQLLMQNPEQGLSQLISQYGGDQARTIVTNIARKMGLLDAAASEADDYVDPQVSALNGRLDKLEQNTQQTQINNQQQRNYEAENQIKLFAEAKDDKGNLVNPHFDTVKSAMGAAITAGAASDMDTAYSQAIWANPELREGLIKTQVDQSNQKAGAARKKTVSQAKKASRNVKTNNVAKSSTVSDKSLLDEIEAAYDQVAG